VHETLEKYLSRSESPSIIAINITGLEISILLATQGQTAVPTIKRKLDTSLPTCEGGGVSRDR
jgi:hypothetical protein